MGKEELGPLPTPAKLLLAALALAWVLIILYAAVSFVRVKRKGRA